VPPLPVRLQRARPADGAAIHDGDPYTQGLANAFRTAFEFLGGAVPVFTATSGQQGADQTALLTEVASQRRGRVLPDLPADGWSRDHPAEGQHRRTRGRGLDQCRWPVHQRDFLSITQSEGMYFSGPDLDFGTNASVTGKTYADIVTAYVAVR
jgi:branched-chain amino acid transport system substrate-binding protein